MTSFLIIYCVISAFFCVFSRSTGQEPQPIDEGHLQFLDPLRLLPVALVLCHLVVLVAVRRAGGHCPFRRDQRDVHRLLQHPHRARQLGQFLGRLVPPVLHEDSLLFRDHLGENDGLPADVAERLLGYGVLPRPHVPNPRRIFSLGHLFVRSLHAPLQDDRREFLPGTKTQRR